MRRDYFQCRVAGFSRTTQCPVSSLPLRQAETENEETLAAEVNSQEENISNRMRGGKWINIESI